MKLSDVRELLKDKRVVEEINRHLWIESQKAGYSIGIERATDEWLRLYAEGWMKYHMADKYTTLKAKTKKEQGKKKKSQKVKDVKKKVGSKKAVAKNKPVVKKKETVVKRKTLKNKKKK